MTTLQQSINNMTQASLEIEQALRESGYYNRRRYTADEATLDAIARKAGKKGALTH